MTNKPLGRKAYGSIGHLPNSRVGPKDHHVHEGQARICTVKARDKHDRVIVQEKLDGSCTAVAMVNGEIVALGRAGWPASTSPYEMHQLFAEWVKGQEERFRAVLREGERLVGEWLAQAHGTRYRLPHEPWVCFDLMLGNRRATVEQLRQAAYRGEFIVPMAIHDDREHMQPWIRRRLCLYWEKASMARSILLKEPCGEWSGRERWTSWQSGSGQIRRMDHTYQN